MSSVVDRLPECSGALYRAGVLSDLDVYLVEMLTRRVARGVVPDYVLLLCALASREVRAGHICLELEGISGEWLRGPTEERYSLPETVAGSCADICVAAVAAGEERLIEEAVGLIGRAASPAPFVLHQKRLYLRRYWNYEEAVAERLLELARAREKTVTPPDNRVLSGLGLNELQQEAVRKALERKLSIISGGPGTGKTYLAARIIYLLLKSGGGELPVIRMAAPTGKAADAIDKSLRGALEKIGDDTISSIPLSPATTLERLLGYKKHSPYFRHNHENPLVADVVLVDEASMIDLPIMAKLLDALSDGCRLILLGDMHQLASVQPGMVLADICAAKSLRPCLTELSESWRFPADSPVGQLARCVNDAVTDEDAARAWSLLSRADEGGLPEDAVVAHESPDTFVNEAGKVDDELSREIIRGYGEFMAADRPHEAFAALAGFRILCATRRGPRGVRSLNRIVEDVLSGSGLSQQLKEEHALPRRLRPAGEFYSHRVIMVTVNDYALGLFNGDVGVILPDENGGLAAWFEPRKDGGDLRRMSLKMLPEHTTAFAITIHKSQGSEFGRIMVVLPAKASPLLTKELVYTAISRTRGGIDIWCRGNVFREAVKARVERASGLGTKLDGLGISGG